MNPMGAARLWQIPTLSNKTGRVRVQLVSATSFLAEVVAVFSSLEPFVADPFAPVITASCSHPTNVLNPPFPPLRLLSTIKYTSAHVQDAKA